MRTNQCPHLPWYKRCTKVWLAFFLYFLTLEDGTDRLFQIVGKGLPLYTLHNNPEECISHVNKSLTDMISISAVPLYAIWPYNGPRDIDSPIPNAVTIRKWVVSALHPSHFTAGEVPPGTNWIGNWVSPRACLNILDKTRYLVPAGNWTPYHLVQKPRISFTSITFPCLFSTLINTECNIT
jgi:hypothetical protein